MNNLEIYKWMKDRKRRADYIFIENKLDFYKMNHLENWYKYNAEE